MLDICSICLINSPGLPGEQLRAGSRVDDWQRPSDPISWAPRGARRGSTLARIMSEDDEEEANPSVPNVLIYVMDDVDLERVPLFAEQDAGAAAQLAELRSQLGIFTAHK